MTKNDGKVKIILGDAHLLKEIRNRVFDNCKGKDISLGSVGFDDTQKIWSGFHFIANNGLLDTKFKVIYAGEDAFAGLPKARYFLVYPSKIRV